MLIRAVSAKARQLNHRLKNRKGAIVSRREAERAEVAARDDMYQSPYYHSNRERQTSTSPPSGFVAVNSKPQQSNGSSSHQDTSSYDQARTTSASANGYSSQGASAATRAELLSKFHTSSERANSASDLDRRGSNSNSRPGLPPKAKSKASVDQLDYPGFLLNAAGASPVPIPNTPSALMPYVKPTAAERYDDSGPYKADMMLRMEQLNRGDRVQPPCDRCRRLHMDCLKNLTACMGCTRKHAKCSWKDVEEQELRDHPFVPRVVLEGGEKGSGDEEGKSKEKAGGKTKKNWSSDEQGVRDEELLGEDESEDDIAEVEKGHGNEGTQRYEAKSHSPTTGTATNDPGERNGTNSAPATTSQPSPASQFAPHNQVENASSTTSALQSTSPTTLMSRLQQKPDIPLYRPPEAPMRSFTAHEWDTHTRSPTLTTHNNNNNTRATPSSEARSDIHDELKSAALEAEKNFERSNLEDGYRSEEPVRVYTSGSEPIATHTSTTTVEKERISPKLQPTPPPEVGEELLKEAVKEPVITRSADEAEDGVVSTVAAIATATATTTAAFAGADGERDQAMPDALELGGEQVTT